MSIKVQYLFSCFFFLVISQTSFGREKNLSAKINLPLALEQIKQAPRLKIDASSKEINQMERKLLWSELGPKIDLSYEINHQDKDGGIPRDSDKTTKLTLTQPLLQGFKEIHHLKQNRWLQNSLEHNERASLLELKISLISSFYLLAQLQEELKILAEQKALYQQRDQVMAKRVAIGKSKKSDYLSNQSQILQSEADIATTQSKITQTKLAIAGLLGASEDFIAPQIIEVTGNPEISWEKLEIGLKNHPLLKSHIAAEEAQSQAVSGAKNEFFPTFLLRSNLYLDREQTTANRGRDWDVALEMNLPLFEGGSDYYQMQKQTQLKEKAAYQTQDTQWRLWGEFKTMHANYIASWEQSALGKKVLKNEQEKVKQMRQEFDLGLINHLDLISATNDMIGAKRKLVAHQVQALSLQSQLALIIESENSP